MRQIDNLVVPSAVFEVPLDEILVINVNMKMQIGAWDNEFIKKYS